MAPKSELMVYLGVAPGHESNFIFMHSPNNVIFTSVHALFNKVQFPKCKTSCKQPAAQDPVPEVEDM